MEQKNVVIVLVVGVVVLLAGYYLWTQNTPRVAAPAPSEATANGEVINSEGSVPETADLEAELNATGADTDADMREFEATFE